jgi:hypothetical protein
MVRELFVWGKYLTYNYFREKAKFYKRNPRQVAGAPPPSPTPFSKPPLYIYVTHCHGLKKVKTKQTSTFRPIQSKSPATTYSTTRPLTTAAPFVPPVRPAYFDADIDSGGRVEEIYCTRPTHRADRVLGFFSSRPNCDPPPFGEFCVPTLWFRGKTKADSLHFIVFIINFD